MFVVGGQKRAEAISLNRPRLERLRHLYGIGEHSFEFRDIPPIAREAEALIVSDGIRGSVDYEFPDAHFSSKLFDVLSQNAAMALRLFRSRNGNKAKYRDASFVQV